MFGEKSPSNKYHRGQVVRYMVDGLSEEEAIAHADEDLVEWSQPLPLPDVDIPEDSWV